MHCANKRQKKSAQITAYKAHGVSQLHTKHMVLLQKLFFETFFYKRPLLLFLDQHFIFSISSLSFFLVFFFAFFALSSLFAHFYVLLYFRRFLLGFSWSTSLSSFFSSFIYSIFFASAYPPRKSNYLIWLLFFLVYSDTRVLFLLFHCFPVFFDFVELGLTVLSFFPRRISTYFLGFFI
jgi:hypothetical protein